MQIFSAKPILLGTYFVPEVQDKTVVKKTY